MAPKTTYEDQMAMQEPPKYLEPTMPPPPYLQANFIKPSSFKAAINSKLDIPIVSLYRLCVRMLQLAFALASGISYALELRNAQHAAKTNYIFAQVVFAMTLVTLVVDSITVRYYRISWLFEWILTILWVTCFGVFYATFLGGPVEPEFQEANLGRMRRAVWMNLINAMLWTSSALFSSAMCCAGTKATIKNKMDRRRQKKEKRQTMADIGDMESGVIGVTSQ